MPSKGKASLDPGKKKESGRHLRKKKWVDRGGGEEGASTTLVRVGRFYSCVRRGEGGDSRFMSSGEEEGQRATSLMAPQIRPAR